MPVKAHASATQRLEGAVEPATRNGAAIARETRRMVSALWSAVSSLVLDHVMCPSCPTQQAAREAFWSDGVASRIAGMIGPFLVTAGLVALVVSRIGGSGRAASALTSEEDNS